MCCTVPGLLKVSFSDHTRLLMLYSYHFCTVYILMFYFLVYFQADIPTVSTYTSTHDLVNTYSDEKLQEKVRLT